MIQFDCSILSQILSQFSKYGLTIFHSENIELINYPQQLKSNVYTDDEDDNCIRLSYNYWFEKGINLTNLKEVMYAVNELEKIKEFLINHDLVEEIDLKEFDSGSNDINYDLYFKLKNPIKISIV